MRRFRLSLVLLCVLALAPWSLAQDNKSTITFAQRYHLQPVEGEPVVKFTCLVPKTLPDRQRVVKQSFSHPASESIDENGARYAVFELNVKTPVLLELEFEIELSRWDLSVAQAQEHPRLVIDKASLRRWLADEKFIEADALEVRELADELRGDNDVQMLRSAVELVTSTLKRGPWDPVDRGALWAVRNKLGDCTEYTDLLVALCRSKGLPARSLEGYLTTPAAKGDTSKHSRAEVYLQNLGWVPVDPLHVQSKIARFDRLAPNYVVLSHLRNDARLSNHHFYVFVSTGGRIRVADEFRVQK